jgi:hypothetical protein
MVRSTMSCCPDLQGSRQYDRSSRIGERMPEDRDGAGREERRRRVEDAAHSGEMEGLPLTSSTSEDAGEYVAGRIDATELRQRVRARYGID